jgi:O-methyltransferase involved in polyketide biosynthesis
MPFHTRPVDYMTRRALIGDELVLDQHRKGTRQVVSLGAGMDSRAFRLGLTDTIFFEVLVWPLWDHSCECRVAPPRCRH